MGNCCLDHEEKGDNSKSKGKESLKTFECNNLLRRSRSIRKKCCRWVQTVALADGIMPCESRQNGPYHRYQCRIQTHSMGMTFTKGQGQRDLWQKFSFFLLQNDQNLSICDLNAPLSLYTKNDPVWPFKGQGHSIFDTYHLLSVW